MPVPEAFRSLFSNRGSSLLVVKARTLAFASATRFFRAYDAQKCAEEAEISQEELTAKNAEKAAKLDRKSVV